MSNTLRAIGLAFAAFLFSGNLCTAADLEWKPLFNGKDLTGWVNVNCGPETFRVQDQMIVCNGIPTGVMRTEKMYENFELELEYKHTVAGGNAGLFVWSDPVTSRGVPFTRSIEIQILDGQNSDTYTSHGDVFSIHGATMVPLRPHPRGWARCLPSERRAKPAGEWNHYHLRCVNGEIELAVNGKVVSGAKQCRPRKGYICLESEGGVVHYRNLRIAELPSSGATGEHVANEDQGFKSLYTGVDLTHWKTEPGHTGHWKPKDWTLSYDGQSEAEDKNLWSTKSYKDFILICDWRLNAKPKKMKWPLVLPTGLEEKNPDGSLKEVEVDDAGDSGIYLRGNSKSQVNIWCRPVGSGEVYGYRTDSQMPASVRAGVTPREKADAPLGEWNRFVIELRGQKLFVNLNGKQVISQAELPGIPAEGPIALQHHGDSVEFANIYIRELP